MYDVFISYRRDGGVDFARLLFEELINRGLKVFFDYEELNNGRFNEKIYSAIDESKNVVVVLSKGSLDRCINDDDWVKNEINHALKNNNIEIIPVMMEQFCFPEKLGEIEDIKYIQAVQYSPAYHNEAVEKLGKRLKGIMWNNKSQTDGNRDLVIERSENKYFNDNNREKELKRLNTQKKLLKKFDIDVYERIIKSYDELRVLDIGSNRGDLVIDRLGHDQSLGKLMGLEYDATIVDEANTKYAIDNTIRFFQADVESDTLSEEIEKYMEQMEIQDFNVIHISMLLLHLNKPFNLLKILRKYLSKDGIIFIRDIDDGLNIAYPDEQNEFKKVVDICNTLDTSGYRHCGRQIYTLLKRTGYHNVILEKNGLSTIEMDYDEREALFDTYFSFILEDAEIMKDRHPNNTVAKENYEWLKNNYEMLEEKFQESSFYFNLGFMTFTARK